MFVFDFVYSSHSADQQKHTNTTTHSSHVLLFTASWTLPLPEQGVVLDDSGRVSGFALKHRSPLSLKSHTHTERRLHQNKSKGAEKSCEPTSSLSLLLPECHCIRCICLRDGGWPRVNPATF